ncbi:MAG: pyridoxal-phosphate dependent enzyme [Halarsenatibacteraceae bacterium]
MIDLRKNEEVLEKAVARAKEKGVVIPTLAQMKNPDLIPEKVKEKLKEVGLWDVDPVNLFRISWQNEPTESGGQYGGVNYVELPSELTGVDARIISLVGKWMPTGAHKIGPTFGCLVPKLVTGQFDPSTEKAVWPSTGNYCRGGAYNSKLLGCDSIAILPEEMSKERFEWLEDMADEVIPTVGSESNVKEIFDKCWELKETRDNINVFNQFDELGNHLWHYEVTGNAMAKAFEDMDGKNLAGVVLASGSAGTLGSADRVKELYPHAKLAVSEALQCPTLLNNGFGAHRIEGIGDKHVPWVHNVRNTDMVMAVDDDHVMNIVRLFNTEVGHEYLKEIGVPEETVENLDLMGISCIANMLSAIKFAKYYELDEDDVVVTVFTDSMELYGSRVEEMVEEADGYEKLDAAVDYERYILGTTIDYVEELTYYTKKRIHNLKYYTWIEQQQKDLEELNAQWYDYENYWGDLHKLAPKIDELINEFNERTGLLEELEE